MYSVCIFIGCCDLFNKPLKFLLKQIDYIVPCMCTSRNRSQNMSQCNLTTQLCLVSYF